MRQEDYPGRDRHLLKAGRARSAQARGFKPSEVVFRGAFVLASAALMWCAVATVRPDPQVRRLLETTPVAQTCRQIRDKMGPAGGPQDSPLVAQAQVFARLINPPRPAEPVAKAGDTAERPISPRPPVSSPKFTLHATTYYAADPARSMALIGEPGGEARWVRQGTRIEHLVIDQIKTGLVVYRDGTRLGEVSMVTDKGPLDPVRVRPAVEQADSADQDVTGQPTPSARVAAAAEGGDNPSRAPALAPARRVKRVALGPGR